MANLITPPELAWADPGYSQSVAAAQQNYTNATTPLLQQRASQAAQYGYTPTYDANGYVQSLAADPNDPYSKAALLTESYKQGQTRNTNSFAGRGQLYAGALNAAQDQGTKGYNIGSNNLQTAFINFIAQNQQGLNDAANTYNTDVTGAYGNAVQNAPAAPTVDAQTAAPATSTAPTGNYVAQGYTGPNGTNTSYQGPSGIYYYDSSGAPHEIKVTDKGRYYMTSSGKWAPLPDGIPVVGA